jgi:hypothetical protein
MADTIEWLETIGTNAKLRHAAAEELASALALADAPDVLKAAVASKDCSQLSVQLGRQPLQTDHSSNATPYGDEPEPDSDQPAESPKPDPDKPQGR